MFKLDHHDGSSRIRRSASERHTSLATTDHGGLDLDPGHVDFSATACITAAIAPRGQRFVQSARNRFPRLEPEEQDGPLRAAEIG